MGGTCPVAPTSSRYRDGGTIRFFAHSISVARSRRGTKRCGGGRALANDEINGPFASSTSPGGAPVCAVHRRESWPSAAAWNVRASTPSTPSARSRAFNSPAAFSVNVTARIWAGRNSPRATWHAIRRVIVVVFPVPAPARMATGPRVARAASRCASFRPSRTRSRSGAVRGSLFGASGTPALSPAAVLQSEVTEVTSIPYTAPRAVPSTSSSGRGT